MKLLLDGNVATLNVTGPHTAEQLDDLLRKLALMRAEMTPAIPETMRELEQTDSSVLVEDKPGLVIAARRNGGFRLWLRHRGFGWLAYQIDNQNATGMADYISHRANAKAANLVEHDEPNRH